MSRVVARVVATLALALGASLAQPAYAAESEFTWLGCEGQPTVTTGSTSSFDKGVWDDEDKAWHGTVYGQLFPCRPGLLGRLRHRLVRHRRSRHRVGGPVRDAGDVRE